MTMPEVILVGLFVFNIVSVVSCVIASLLNND